ncbi:MAG: hypothetical protein IJY27_07990 [Clostridia bacterium]|nr:hypothetical protein [Clostridia bacterium]
MFFQSISRLFSVLTAEPSLWEELWEYFNDKYFTPDYGDYTYIEISESSMVSLPAIVFAFFIGINIAAIAAIFNKRVLGDFARALISVEAHTPETAQTLEQLGYLKNTAIRSSLKNGTTLRRVVKCVEEEAYYAELEKKRREFEASNTDPKAKFKEIPFSMDVSTAHFYIPEDQKYTAELKFEKKGTNWLTFAGVFIGSIVISLLVIWVVPELLQMLDNFLGMFSGTN